MKSVQTKYFTAFYDDGAIRQVKLGRVEIVRMICAAVRDQNWGTIEPKILGEKITQNENGFHIDLKVQYKKNDIHFEANYLISGEDNRLVFRMNGEAKATFKSNRIGFCALHPIKECVGQKCKIVHPDGSSTIYNFPEQIAAHQPMKNIDEMYWKPAETVEAKLTFTGDIFEMEDQRNWTDASYKTYCRPLDLPFPFQIKKGERIEQKVELHILTDANQNANNQEYVTFKIDKNRTFILPKIGAEATSRAEDLTSNEANILKQLPLDHLRVGIKFTDKNWHQNLKKSCSEASKLDVPLFLVLYFSENHVKEILGLRNAFSESKTPVKNILVVGKNHLPHDTIFDAVFGELKKLFPNAKIGSGVNAYFAELNRNRPKSGQAEFINFTISPQVHAFDDFSLVENLEAQKYAVESAKKLFAEKPIYVSPITLKQRFNVVATAEELPPLSGELPSQVDPRQNSVFAAQWLLGSIKFLAQSETALATLFETVGWRGYIQGEFEPPVPEKFSAKVGDVFPVYHVLKELVGFDEVVFSESSLPLKVEGLVLQSKSETKILLANFSGNKQAVEIVGAKDFLKMRFLFENKLEMTTDKIILPSNDILVITK